MWLVPVVALAELIAFVVQLSPTMSEADWKTARELVAKQATARDLIVFAPSWIRPLGHEHFGDELMTLKRSAFPDVSRFDRVFELDWHGHRHPDVADWPQAAARRIGPFVLRTLTNPSVQPVVDDPIGQVENGSASVQVKIGASWTTCAFRRLSPISGPLAYGPAAPSARYQCPRNAWVAPTVLADLDYRPRRCIYAPPPARGAIRLTFHSVRYGMKIIGHHGLYVVSERDRKGAPVTIRLSAAGKHIGSSVHRDGDGWSTFSFETPTLKGSSDELTVEISSTGAGRMYCFEVTTR